MSEPNWLTPEEVIRINMKVVERSNEPHFVRDRGLLESALGRPKNLHAYDETDTFQLAASYAEGVSRNHSFEQGNKRTALLCADMFLSQNDYELQEAKGLEHVEMMEQLGQGKITRDQAAAYLREHSRQIEQERQTEQPTKKDWSKKPAQSKPSKRPPAPKRDMDRER
ncbi:type II toxin-antitoxin system death-on-curing family toxin [Roseovarius sp. ZX-A-9]|uniref:type II toxin-antitoxin system death-on-curing family toxin n=1 Tax=Roseovarius sp. ZX-A-9 TaxID=3014783 RepID=UPI00232F70CA|nr:type II toxin-antitoxin system death-on-curing family toxin [Roseovarius sp. ZX-A-9]